MLTCCNFDFTDYRNKKEKEDETEKNLSASERNILNKEDRYKNSQK